MLNFFAVCDKIKSVIYMYKKIDQKTAKSIIDSRPCTILDVRTEEEFVQGHIENAVCIPVDDLEKRLDELPDREQLILVCCRSGKSSRAAAEYLNSAGYKNVLDIGGLVYWEYGVVTWE